MCRMVGVRSPSPRPSGKWTSTASLTPSRMVTNSDHARVDLNVLVVCAAGLVVTTSDSASAARAAASLRRGRTIGLAVFVSVDEGVHQDAVFVSHPAIGLAVAVGVEVDPDHLTFEV